MLTLKGLIKFFQIVRFIYFYINIIIIDNGLGFVSQNTKDIIKPYYTTKQKGSGLGLSIVNKIINDHNGSIEFKTIQFGAKVEIILPIKNVS